MKKNDPRDIYPKFPKSAYRAAAKRIREARLHGILEYSEHDEEIIEKWRASHRHVLNAWQVTLKQRIKGRKIIFAQRLKRRNTIYDKLIREPTMALIKMHDIAGCRLIFQNQDDMFDYINQLHFSKKIKHKLVKEQNYILNPKETGYRGIHNEYQYLSRNATDRSHFWDGLLLEIQFRTIYQHAWATAVEVADNILHDRIKFNDSSNEKKEFFKLASEIIARVYEDQKSCLPNLTNEELISNFEKIEQHINLLERLKQLKSIKNIHEWKSKNIILHFSVDKLGRQNLIAVFNTSFSKANQKYFQMEKESPMDDIVLVRASDLKNAPSIRKSYKNYFSDARDFVEYIENGISLLKGEKFYFQAKYHKQLRVVHKQYEFDLNINNGNKI